MDRATLLQHRDRWVREPSATSAALSRLTPEDAAVYGDLVTDRFGASVRLEQERVDWPWAMTRLPNSSPGGIGEEAVGGSCASLALEVTGLITLRGCDGSMLVFVGHR
jgi:hypothetical protein